VAEIKVGENLWKDFVAVAKRHRKNPASLAARVLREYLQRIADEELLRHSERAAQSRGITIAQAEAAIKELRRKSRP
jgi:hypothetical protein